MREIEHQHLLQIAGLQGSTITKWRRHVVSWLGKQMVAWGSKLQSYEATAPELLTKDVKNHRLKYS